MRPFVVPTLLRQVIAQSDLPVQLWEERLVVLKAALQGTRWNAVLLGKGDTATRRKGKGCCLPNVLPWHEALYTYALFSHSLPPPTVINLKGRYRDTHFTDEENEGQNKLPKGTQRLN